MDEHVLNEMLVEAYSKGFRVGFTKGFESGYKNRFQITETGRLKEKCKNIPQTSKTSTVKNEKISKRTKQAK